MKVYYVWAHKTLAKAGSAGPYSSRIEAERAMTAFLARAEVCSVELVQKEEEE